MYLSLIYRFTLDSTDKVNTPWLRELSLFMEVEATVLFIWPTESVYNAKRSRYLWRSHYSIISTLSQKYILLGPFLAVKKIISL